MSWQGKSVLITGATGFIGGALALRLAAEGAQVTGLARTPSKGAFLQAAGVALAQADITDPDGLRRAVEASAPAVLFHLAAIAGAEDTRQMQAVNVEGTYKVLEAARAAQVERLVHVSTISVYGYRRRGVVDEDARLGHTGDSYGDTKMLGEGLVQRSGLPWSIIRPAQVYGPRSGAWTLRMLDVTNNFVPLVGGGRGACHPIYIDDLVALLLLAGEHPAALGQVFNGSPDPPATWLAFLGAYAQMQGQTRYVDIPPWLLRPPARLLDLLLRLSGERMPIGAAADFLTAQVTYTNRKARERLGWAPQVSLDEGMQRTEAWLRSNGYLA